MPPPDDKRNTAVRAALAEEEYRGLRLTAVARLVALAVVAVWVTIENRFPEVLFYLGVIVGFALLGLLPWALRRAGRNRWWHPYLFALLDMVLFTIVALVPNP